jgi:hypothetical protein
MGFLNRVKENQLEVLMVLTAPLFLLHTGTLSYLFMLFWALISLLEYLRGNKALFFTFLLINTFQTFGSSIYKSDFLWVSTIYWVLLLWLFIELRKLKKISLIVVPFLFFFPVRVLLGFVYKFSLKYLVIESILFFAFIFMVLLFFNESEPTKKLFINRLKKYILYFFPYLTLISMLKGPMIDYKPFFLDEFGHFYLISIFPIIFFSGFNRQKKLFLILAHLIFILIRMKYLYISSFAFIGAGMGLFLIVFFNFLSIWRYFLGLVVLAYVFLQIISYSSVFGKHKIDQIKDTIAVLAEINTLEGIKKIPNSPKTRVVEILNIGQNLNESGAFTLALGKGFGSYFTDLKYPFKDFSVRIDTSAFTAIEIASRRYLRPHNTIPYLFLKTGILGLVFVLILLLASFLKLKKNNWLLYAYAPYVLILFGAGLKNFIIIGILTGIILKGIVSHRNGNSALNIQPKAV